MNERGEHADRSVVGWREMVDLPEWGVLRVRAKVDTGARTSAMHVAAIEDLGSGRVRFEVVSRDGPGKRKTVWVESEVVRLTRVKPSSGERQRRPVVRTTLRIGSFEREIEVSLVSREGLLCRMLVGRRAIAGSLVVDPGRRYALSEPPRKRRLGSGFSGESANGGAS